MVVKTGLLHWLFTLRNKGYNGERKRFDKSPALVWGGQKVIVYLEAKYEEDG